MDRIESWVKAGLISADQGESIKQFEETGVAQPAAEPGGLRAVLAEIAGYLGAALIVTALAALLRDLWQDLSPWLQIGIVALITFVLGWVGLSIRDSEEPALRRLAAVLLALAPGGIAWTLYIFGVEVFRNEEGPFIPVVLLVAALAATWFYRIFAHFFTQASTFVLWVWFVASVPNTIDSLDSRVWWILLLALGVAWLMLTEAGVLVPERLGHVLGTGAALIGAGGSSDYGWDPWFPGLLVAAAIVAFGVYRAKPVLVGLGAGGFFIFLAMLLFEELNESAALLVLLVIGVLLVVGVWAWSRRSRSPSAG